MSDEADYTERLKSTGRNDRCPCDSGKKYKKCHLAEDEAKRTAALKVLEDEAKARAAEKAEAEEEGEDDASATAKSKSKTKQGAGRRKEKKSGSKAQGGGGKPKNVIRRGAV